MKADDDVQRAFNKEGEAFFCQRPFDYLQHHSQATENDQLKISQTLNQFTPNVLAGPDEMISQALYGPRAGHSLFLAA